MLAAFREFDQRRSSVLPYARALCADPLLMAASITTGPLLSGYVDAYASLLSVVESRFNELAVDLGPDAQDIVAYILLLESI